MKSVRLTIDPFTDTADPSHQEKAIEAVPHVRSVEIDPQAHCATLEHGVANPDEITTALRELGYHARVSA